MYPAELEIKDTTESTTSAFYLDLLLSIGRDGQLHTSIYDKRDDFNFHITNFPFLSSNIPSSPAYGVFISQLIRYSRACSSYECFILRARRLSSKLLKQGYLAERLKSSCRKFYGRYGDLTQQYEVSLSRMLNDILILDQQWLPNQSDFPPVSWPWYRAWPSPIMSGFHGAFATGVACQQGTLTLPDTWFRPLFWDLLMLQLLGPNSSNLPCLYSTFHLEYPLVLSRFCFYQFFILNRVLALCLSWLISFTWAYSICKKREARITKWRILATKRWFSIQVPAGSSSLEKSCPQQDPNWIAKTLPIPLGHEIWYTIDELKLNQLLLDISTGMKMTMINFQDLSQNSLNRLLGPFCTGKHIWRITSAAISVAVVTGITRCM